MKQIYYVMVLFFILIMNSCSEDTEVNETKIDYSINITGI